MKFSTRNFLKLRNLTLAFIAVLSLAVATQAQTYDYQKTWTTVGSAGTVDEADTSKVEFTNSKVQLKGSGPIVVQPASRSEAVAEASESEAEGKGTEALIVRFPTESATVRYNVTAVDGLFMATPNWGGDIYGMTVRYLASGPGGRVVVRLIEVDIFTGQEVERMNFDSANFPSAAGYVTNGIGVTHPHWKFDFTQKAYYLETTLSRSSLLAGGSAGLAAVKLNASFRIN
jgi:hypothetical protein